ncbi:MAG: radical SAM protein [Candidatus Lokiarchaeota archaeon]|nr:radical SAM protein [Candidatus Lokiarchaeota archaeon]
MRFENLPDYIPENIIYYRSVLKRLLFNIYERFPYDIVAISCYTSFHYLNTLEIACLIKKEINTKCCIVIGGVHPTICEEEFQIGNLPDHIYDVYPIDETPIDYLVKNEGEKPFFHLVKGFSESKIKCRISDKEDYITLKSEIIEDLDELPIIDLSLYKKYASDINLKHGDTGAFLLSERDYSKNGGSFRTNAIVIDFTRGCASQCKFCPLSGDSVDHWKKVRLRSIKKCIEDLNALKNTKWLNIENIQITDMTFLPKRSQRQLFFEEMKKNIKLNGDFPFNLIILERIDTCLPEDLENYKNLNIVPHFGLESTSRTMLYRMGKVPGKNDKEIFSSIDRYLKKFIEIVKKTNELNLIHEFYYMLGTPGEDRHTLKEAKDFLFQTLDGDDKALIKNYKINLMHAKYAAYPGSHDYNCSEKEYGSKIYYKKFWRIFDKKQAWYSIIVDPGSELSLLESVRKNAILLKKIYKIQLNMENTWYKTEKLDSSIGSMKNLLDLLKKLFYEENSTEEKDTIKQQISEKT